MARDNLPVVTPSVSFAGGSTLANRRLSIPKIREVLRLYVAAALSIRAIARSLGTSPSTVGEYLRRAKVAGRTWPVRETIDDAGLERRLFPAPPSLADEVPGRRARRPGSAIIRG